MKISPGLYRHYKGQHYQVFGLAHHSETREPLVVYRCLYGDFSLWLRPLAMFTETVAVADEEIPRFQFLRPLTEADVKTYPAPDWLKCS